MNARNRAGINTVGNAFADVSNNAMRHGGFSLKMGLNLQSEQVMES